MKQLTKDWIIIILIIVLFIIVIFGKHLNNYLLPKDDRVNNIELMLKADSIYNAYLEISYYILKVERDVNSKVEAYVIYKATKEHDSLITKRIELLNEYMCIYNSIDSNFKNKFYLPKPY